MKKTIVMVILGITLLSGVFALSSFLTNGRSILQNVGFVDGRIYTINQSYNNFDYLDSFVKQGNTIQLYSNPSTIAGTNYFGFWSNPFNLTQTGPRTYSTGIFNIVSTENRYDFTIQPNGDILVWASHQSCYPNGCQSNIPLTLVGTFS